MTKSKTIENLIENMVENGIIQAGEAVPSIREMAAMYEMSVTPVIVAYHNLEERGILQARSKSKFVVLPKPEPVSPPPDPITDKYSRFTDLHHILSERTSSFPYGSIEAFTNLSSNEIMLKKFARSMRSYMSPEELQAVDEESIELKASLSKWMYKCNCMVTTDDIVVTNGSYSSALSLALKCCTHAGDLVGVAEPGDIAHYLAALSRGLVPVPIHHTPGMGLDIEAFEQAIHNNPGMRVIICNANFDVPTGTLMPPENKQRLVELCRRHNITIVEDDRNGALGHKGFRPQPLASLAPDNVIYIGCVNFTGAIGMRIHWIVNRIHSSELRYYSKMMGLIPPIFIQNAYRELVNSSLAGSRRIAVCTSYLESTTLVRKAVYRFFPSGTIAYQPSGGYFLWVKLPESCDAVKLSHKAFASGMTVMPGILFSDKAIFRNYICLNCSVACINPDWETGIRTLGTLTKVIMEESSSSDKQKG